MDLKSQQKLRELHLFFCDLSKLFVAAVVVFVDLLQIPKWDIMNCVKEELGSSVENICVTEKETASMV